MSTDHSMNTGHSMNTDSGAAGDQASPAAPGHARTPRETGVTLAHIMTAVDTNLYGTVHGGVIMKLVDDAAAAAARHAGGPAVTVSVDQITFLNPAQVGDLLTATAVVAHVGHTSLDLQVVVTAERWDAVGAPRPIVDAFLTFVAVDADGRPRRVPPLRLETDTDHDRSRRAAERRARRRLGN